MPSHATVQSTSYQSGGRVGSAAFWASREHAEAFAGLQEGADRYGLLVLVKRVGKLGGFTPRMICLLDYYVAYTRDTDWEEGGRPIVYQSLSRTALDLGVSERQVQKLEAALFDAGAITWKDSGNHKRYGRRCPCTGRIEYAYGVDLSPLAFLRDELQATLTEKQRRDEAWLAAKRAISELRRECRALMAEGEERGGRSLIAAFIGRYEAIAVQIRTHLPLQGLEKLLDAHRELASELREAVAVAEAGPRDQRAIVNASTKTRKCSSTSEAGFAHYNYTTQATKASCSPGGGAARGSVAEPSPLEPAGSSPSVASAMEHVTLAMAVGAASYRFRACLPEEPGWDDLIEAAYLVRRDLGVSQASWGEACQVLGRSGAAVALLLTDRAASRGVDPVRTPPAYFRGMVRRGEAGQLRLCRSLFGLLEKGVRS